MTTPEQESILNQYRSHPLFGKGPKFQEDGTIDTSIYKAPLDGSPCEGCIRNRRPHRCGHRKVNKPILETIPPVVDTPPGGSRRPSVTVIPEYRREGEPYSFSVGRETTPWTGRTWSPKLYLQETISGLEIVRPFKHFVSVYKIQYDLSHEDKRKRWFAKCLNKPKKRLRLLSKLTYLKTQRLTSLRNVRVHGEYIKMNQTFDNYIAKDMSVKLVYLLTQPSPWVYPELKKKIITVETTPKGRKPFRYDPSMNRPPQVLRLSDLVTRALLELGDIDESFDKILS